MQYNSHATEQDIVSLTNVFTKQNNTSFPLTEKTTYTNMGNRIILTEIFNAYGGWKYDDRNNTDFPIATTNLVANQVNYSLPIDTVQLNGVYFLEEGTSSTWTKLQPITLEQINRLEAEPNFNNTPSTPQYYRVLSNSIKLYPAPDFSQDSSLMVEYSRDVSTFATTDTTKTPGFDIIFHEALPIYNAMMFAKVNLSSEVANNFEGQWSTYLARIKRHYSQKFKDMFPARMSINKDLSVYL